MVIRFGNKNFGGATYDTKCPFDMAQKLVDECDHRGKDYSWVRDVINWEMHDHYYTVFGKEYVEAFNLLTGYGIANNKGVPQHRIDFYIRFYDYLIKNKKSTRKVWDDLFKLYRNNKDDRDFSKFADLELFKKRDAEIIAQLKHRDRELSWKHLQREYNEAYAERIKNNEKVD